jgi:hypothetical protein
MEGGVRASAAHLQYESPNKEDMHATRRLKQN